MIGILVFDANERGKFNEFSDRTVDFNAYFHAAVAYIDEQYALSSGYEYVRLPWQVTS